MWRFLNFWCCFRRDKKRRREKKKAKTGSLWDKFLTTRYVLSLIKTGGGRIRLPATSHCYYKAELSASIHYLPLPVKNSGLGKIEYLNTDTAGMSRLNITPPKNHQNPWHTNPPEKGALEFQAVKEGSPRFLGLGAPDSESGAPRQGALRQIKSELTKNKISY